MRLSGLLLVLMGIVLAGCGAGEKDLETSEVAPAMRLLLVDEPVHVLGQLAREPMVVAHPSGTLFLSGFGSQIHGVDPNQPPYLWRSTDGGTNWTPVDVGTAEQGARGNSDVDLAVGPGGELYFVVMGYDRSTYEGTHIVVGVSHDVGESWVWTSLSEDRGDDRPWVAVAPDGTAHLVWNDGKGVSHAKSTDGGLSWIETVKVSDTGGSSHFAVGPKGELAVRITPLSASGRQFDEGFDKVAVSLDQGNSWVLHDFPGQAEWDRTLEKPGSIPRWVEPVAWDEEGSLYLLWSGGTNINLARSQDRGENWVVREVVNDQMSAFFPYLVARGSGELAATWFTRDRDEDRLYVNLALIRDGATAEASLETVRADGFEPQTWRDTVETRAPDTAGEYVPVIFLADGALGVATPVQDPHNGRYGFTWWRFRVE